MIRQRIHLILSHHQNRLGARTGPMGGHHTHLSRHGRLPGRLGHPALPGHRIRPSPVDPETPNIPVIPARHMVVIDLTPHQKRAGRVQGRPQAAKSKGMANGSWSHLLPALQWALEVDPTLIRV